MTGLTPFILAMMRAPVAALRRANTAKLATKYGIPVAWADFYLKQWISR